MKKCIDPITLAKVDKPVKGHIIPTKMEVCQAHVPVDPKIDNLFGCKSQN